MDDKSIFAQFLGDGLETVVVGGKKDVEILNNQSEVRAKHAVRTGAKLTTPKKKAKVKKYNSEDWDVVNNSNVKPSAVVDFNGSVDQITGGTIERVKVIFSNDFGRIKMNVEKVIYAGDIGIGLIFANEDDIVFEPKNGETITLTIIPNTYDVLYPGALFDLPYGERKLMVLYKTDVKDNTDSEGVNKGIDN